MTPQCEEAKRLLRLATRDQAAFNALCVVPEVDIAVALFHAQQSAEKTLKSVMCLHHLEYRRTHDLEELAARLSAANVSLPVTEEQLSRFSICFILRYRKEKHNGASYECTQAIIPSISRKNRVKILLYLQQIRSAISSVQGRMEGYAILNDSA